ncbi:MAG: glycosyltransferase family 4 protein [Candidatus Scalindua sp.]
MREYGCNTFFVKERHNQGVVISHPGIHHAYQIVLGLQEAGLLQKFITRFYYKNQGGFATLIRLFPPKYAKTLQREFKRRRLDGLDENLIRSFLFGDLALKTLRLIGMGSIIPSPVILSRNARFDARAARIVSRFKPSAVFCFDGCALETFKAARKVGAVCILSQMIGHIKKGKQILQKEARLNPEFADTISAIIPNSLIERCTQEALLADYVLVGSDYVRETLVENGVTPARLIVLPYGADTASFYPLPKDDNSIFRILFVGGISQRKGIKYLLEAFKRLDLPNTELVLVGSIIGSDKGLKSYRDIFKHIPHVPHFKIHTLFQSADIFIYPSLHEGSAIAIYEALASGLPVITTPNAGSVVRNDEEGFIVPIRNVEGLMEKILLLYKDRDLRESMSKKARERAETFTWITYRQSLGKLVRGFIEEKAS